MTRKLQTKSFFAQCLCGRRGKRTWRQNLGNEFSLAPFSLTSFSPGRKREGPSRDGGRNTVQRIHRLWQNTISTHMSLRYSLKMVFDTPKSLWNFMYMYVVYAHIKSFFFCFSMDSLSLPWNTSLPEQRDREKDGANDSQFSFRLQEVPLLLWPSRHVVRDAKARKIYGYAKFLGRDEKLYTPSILHGY